MITDEMRANAPICPKHNERTSLWLCDPMGYAGEPMISAECYWCTREFMDADLMARMHQPANQMMPRQR